MFGRKKKKEEERKKADEWFNSLSEEERRKYINAVDELYPILKDMGLSEEETYKEIGKRLNLETEKVVALVEVWKWREEAIRQITEGIFDQFIKVERVDKRKETEDESKKASKPHTELSDRELLSEILKELKRNNELLTALIVRFDEYRNREEEKYMEFVEWLAGRLRSLEIAAS